jgi:hypothetical protein
MVCACGTGKLAMAAALAAAAMLSTKIAVFDAARAVQIFFIFLRATGHHGRAFPA